MIETFLQPLDHGITLSCRAAGERGRPVLLFLHGFPEGAFVWDALLEHFARPEYGGYRCVAPNLRGYERSSVPTDVQAYRPKHLVQDIAALARIEADADAPLAALIAHDWGGAVAWNFANQLPARLRKLIILNSPHPGTFLRELKISAPQQTSSAYMNALVLPTAEAGLAANDFAALWPFFSAEGPKGPWPTWLTPAVQDQYRDVWSYGLTGACNYYRASPLRPPQPHDPAALAVELPHSMLTVNVPTHVIWGMGDWALPPTLLDGLEHYVPQLTVHKVASAGHWIVHEQPEHVQQLIARSLGAPGPLQT